MAALDQLFEVDVLPPQDKRPPLDPHYISQMDQRGRIVHQMDEHALTAVQAPSTPKTSIATKLDSVPVPDMVRAAKHDDRTPNPFPEPQVYELPDRDPLLSQSSMQVLSLHEAREEREKEEVEKDRKRERQEQEEEEEDQEDVKTEESARTKQWRFWSSMPNAMDRFVDQWVHLVCDQSCVRCDRAMCLKNIFKGSNNESSMTTRYPWDAELAHDDVDAEAVQRMRAHCIRSVLHLRKELTFDRDDVWMFQPCRHVVHGYPCALDHLRSAEKDECPQCKNNVTALQPAQRVLLASGDEHQRWIAQTLQCPPPMLSSATSRALSGRHPADPTLPWINGGDGNDDGRRKEGGRGDFKRDGTKQGKKLLRLRDAMDLAQQRLVKKYVLLDAMQTALDDQDAMQFAAVAEQMEALVPSDDAKRYTWQVLEPPREHRPNVERALALTKLAAVLEQEFPLRWLKEHGFIDRDTMRAFKTVEPTWFASLPRTSQRLLFEQVVESKADKEPWLRAAVQAGLHEASTIGVLRPTNATKWADEAEAHGRYAVAVELRKTRKEKSN